MYLYVLLYRRQDFYRTCLYELQDGCISSPPLSWWGPRFSSFFLYFLFWFSSLCVFLLFYFICLRSVFYIKCCLCLDSLFLIVPSFFCRLLNQIPEVSPKIKLLQTQDPPIPIKHYKIMFVGLKIPAYHPTFPDLYNPLHPVFNGLTNWNFYF